MDVRVRLKAGHQRIDAFELWCWRRLESPMVRNKIQPVNPKGNQSWIFIGKPDAEAETPKFWPPDAKNWLIGKSLMLGKIEGGRRRGRQRMVGCHHWLNVHELEQVPEVGWWTGKADVLQSLGSQNWTGLSNWTGHNKESKNRLCDYVTPIW